MSNEPRIISKKHYQSLKSELSYIKAHNIIDDEQYDKSMLLYQPKQDYSFTKVILTVAAVLIGIGILSFIAGNWNIIPAAVKFLLVVFLQSAAFYAFVKTAKSYPKTSVSFLYLGILIFGGGIFLVQQIFNITFNSNAEFLLWGLGIIPIAFVYKDKFVLFAAQLLILSYIVITDFSLAVFTVIALVMMLLYHKLNEHYKEGSFLLTLSFAVSFLSVIGKFLYILEPEAYIAAALYFVVGIAMFYWNKPGVYNKSFINWIGTAVILVSGVFLTIEETYSYFGGAAFTIAVIFAALYAAILLYWLKKGRIQSIILICSLILRYYFDLTFRFSSKSLVFIVAGLILGAFGFWFEKERREGGLDDGL